MGRAASWRGSRVEREGWVGKPDEEKEPGRDQLPGSQCQDYEQRWRRMENVRLRHSELRAASVRKQLPESRRALVSVT